MNDGTFLSNSFEDEDNNSVIAIAPKLSSSSSSSDDDDDVIDEFELDDADNAVGEPHVPSLPRKQGFANLDEVTNYENFNPILPDEHANFWYSSKNKSYVVEWEMTREENLRQSGRPPAHNVLPKRAGPTL